MFSISSAPAYRRHAADHPRRSTASRTDSESRAALSLFIRNHGSISINQAGALRANTKRCLRAAAGQVERSSDGQADHRMTLPSLPTNQAFIDEADAALLKETLERAEPATRFIRLRGTSSSARWVWKSSEIFGPGPKPKRPPTLTN